MPFHPLSYAGLGLFRFCWIFPEKGKHTICFETLSWSRYRSSQIATVCRLQGSAGSPVRPYLNGAQVTTESRGSWSLACSLLLPRQLLAPQAELYRLSRRPQYRYVLTVSRGTCDTHAVDCGIQLSVRIHSLHVSTNLTIENIVMGRQGILTKGKQDLSPSRKSLAVENLPACSCSITADRRLDEIPGTFLTPALL